MMVALTSFTTFSTQVKPFVDLPPANGLGGTRIGGSSREPSDFPPSV